MLPTAMVDDSRVVVMAGELFWAVNSSHDDVAPLLFESPLYTAMKLKLPVELSVTDLEFGTTPFVTVTIETAVAGAAQLPFA